MAFCSTPAESIHACEYLPAVISAIQRLASSDAAAIARGSAGGAPALEAGAFPPGAAGTAPRALRRRERRGRYPLQMQSEMTPQSGPSQPRRGNRIYSPANALMAQPSLSFLNGDELLVFRSNIVRRRTNDLAVFSLLDHVCGPSRRTRDDEKWSEHRGRHAEHVIADG